jgi:hypothetical protein
MVFVILIVIAGFQIKAGQFNRRRKVQGERLSLEDLQLLGILFALNLSPALWNSD